MEEKRYKIIELKESVKEERNLIGAFSATSVVYAGIAALLLYTGINKIGDESYVSGIISTVMGTSFALSDLFVIRGLKDFINDYINDKEEYEKLSR